MRRLSIVLLVCTLAACEGAEGPAGAVGPEGPVGPQGPPGSVNVTSTTFTINSSLTGFAAQQNVSMPSITADVLADGYVAAYYSSNGARWIAMPFTLHVGSNSVTLGFAIETGMFVLQQVSSFSQDGTLFGGDMIRVVTVPPGAGKRDVDYSNYSEVARAYGL